MKTYRTLSPSIVWERPGGGGGGGGRKKRGGGGVRVAINTNCRKQKGKGRDISVPGSILANKLMRPSILSSDGISCKITVNNRVFKM